MICHYDFTIFLLDLIDSRKNKVNKKTTILDILLNNDKL